MTRDLSKFSEAAKDVFAGTMIPYLGPGIHALSENTIPTSPEDMCKIIEEKVRVPKRSSGNMWSAAQYVESRKFRGTLDAIVEEAFATSVSGNPVHEWLSTARPPLVVDTWYDDGLLNAYAKKSDTWGWVQGMSQTEGNGLTFEGWTRTYDASGSRVDADTARNFRSLIYKPHGMAGRKTSFLMSDSDYVEVLTEIDIQTPIPEEVQDRRTSCGFLFLGCRFNDQMLRIFARQIMKRSGGKHYAVIPGELTRMERRFLDEMRIERINAPLEFAMRSLQLEAA